MCCAVSSSRCPPSGCSEATRAPRVAHHIGTAPAQVDLYLGFGGTPFRIPISLEDGQTSAVIVEQIRISRERVIADVHMSCNVEYNSPDSMEACWYSFCYARRWTLGRSLGAVTQSNLILSDQSHLRRKSSGRVRGCNSSQSMLALRSSFPNLQQTWQAPRYSKVPAAAQ